MANIVGTWAPLIAGLGGVGGFAAVARIWSERSSRNRDLTVTLNATARDWIDYIDKKFDDVSTELERSKLEQRRRDEIRHSAWLAHRAWDVAIKERLETLIGERIDDPPPLDPI